MSEVIISTFDIAIESADQELDPERWQDASTRDVIRQIVQHVVRAMSGEIAGAMRAALKRNQIGNSALEPALSYRATVTERAVMLLSDRLSQAADPSESIRVAMQMIHATVLDALLHDRGPLFSETQRMINELSDMMTTMLGL